MIRDFLLLSQSAINLVVLQNMAKGFDPYPKVVLGICPSHKTYCIVSMIRQLLKCLKGKTWNWDSKEGNKMTAVCGRKDNTEHPPETNEETTRLSLRKMHTSWKYMISVRVIT